MNKTYKLNLNVDESMINEEINLYKTKTNYFKEEIDNFTTSKIFYETLLGKLQKQINSEEKLTDINVMNTSLSKIVLNGKINRLSNKN